MEGVKGHFDTVQGSTESHQESQKEVIRTLGVVHIIMYIHLCCSLMDKQCVSVIPGMHSLSQGVWPKCRVTRHVTAIVHNGEMDSLSIQ